MGARQAALSADISELQFVNVPALGRFVGAVQNPRRSFVRRLHCLDDRGGWGRALARVANDRGWQASMFLDADDVRGDARYAFMRINQGGQRMRAEKASMAALAARGLRMIPDLLQGQVYEDKVEQVVHFGQWMPSTFVLWSAADARQAVGAFGFPFVSKARDGSASRNVRLIHTETEALLEIAQAFAEGLPTAHRLGEPVQRGYLIWQKFLAGNAYDYRVCAIGRARMILRRGNRDDVPFASGSGRTEPVTILDDETAAVLAMADAFFASARTHWCGIDLVRDREGPTWRVLESTLGWQSSAYAGCALFGSQFFGRDVWRVLLDEIEAGVFDGTD